MVNLYEQLKETKTLILEIQNRVLETQNEPPLEYDPESEDLVQNFDNFVETTEKPFRMLEYRRFLYLPSEEIFDLAGLAYPELPYKWSKALNCSVYFKYSRGLCFSPETVFYKYKHIPLEDPLKETILFVKDKYNDLWEKYRNRTDSYSDFHEYYGIGGHKETIRILELLVRSKFFGWILAL